MTLLSGGGGVGVWVSCRVLSCRVAIPVLYVVLTMHAGRLPLQVHSPGARG
jgi:hypothetical protein